MTATIEQLRQIAVVQPYPLLFATISGAHLYGFSSPDLDYNLRGVHVLPLWEIIGLETGPETLEVAEEREGLELDLVTNDVRKFFALLLIGFQMDRNFAPSERGTIVQHPFPRRNRGLRNG